MPAIEIGERCARILVLKFSDGCGIKLESEKGEIVLAQECLDLRNRESMFHDIEQQVATAAQGVEVGAADEIVPARGTASQQLLPAPSNAFGRRAIGPLRNECARFDDRAGGSSTALDIGILQQLALTPRGQVPVHTPSTQGQPHMADQYDVGISIFGNPQIVCHVIPVLPVIEGQFKAQGID
jgi:hypothetical protein